MPFSIPEAINFFLYLVFALLACRVFWKHSWSTGAKIVLGASTLIVATDLIEYYLGEVSSLYFVIVLVFLGLVVGLYVLRGKKPK
ncbi:hypothetical protein A2572_01970 [Candidatus Collierbacteria bacterium RIFOXYD1_FULL_40_9]|uniref:Uncharacterized protein n=1 Tax=Candidatus Collierbacteria bacterium RIFOXYD1_FULL_40_9 TaxID=1817731 RepID=A0A1F5FTA7_9BACT|nr:MAG: hypothetical protein A2572_01970 [Candidatus Collierbacteria bacterium RIFOXYD1_FULL_40_9]